MLARRAALAARGAIATRVSPRRPAFAAHAATARRATLRRSSTYTVAAIEDGDDAAWRKLLSDADFLAAVEESEDLAAAFVRRMDQQTVEISRLGAPEGEAPEIWTYAAHLFSHEEPAVLATARVAVWPRVEINFSPPTGRGSTPSTHVAPVTAAARWRGGSRRVSQ